ncbi:GNAT family N-acetyltransferase [Crateriforma conspicua]|uniref:Ribosomal-protein-alanine N-acetyltransferase n=1 Tax=Crateriforma conspicua TaxID=2527996 RepID=A0A5C5XSY3_9PLAN|nr:GNAT family N-acetyltransferase [Crateriforma conspicua]TWT65651.1 ribosomal-protein-alanine N-acetyltransferase [Crateriforma conspicua]
MSLLIANGSEEFNIRWMIRRDMPDVLGIEDNSFAEPWSLDDFTKCLRQRSVIGFVAETDDRVVGFMIYQLHLHHIELLSLAVEAGFRQCGIGSAMIGKLRGKLSHERRSSIQTFVSESSLDAQLFFKARGFRCIEIVHDHFETPNADASTAYLMQFSYSGCCTQSGNRISGFFGSNKEVI